MFLGALVAVWLCAAWAPERVEALVFSGESLVLNPAKTDLTGPAKTILTNPTFLPEEVAGATSLGGTGESSSVVGILQGAGLLPALGSVLSFGVGTVIGSEICHVVGIEGCWYFGSQGADPSPPAKSKWIYRTTPLMVGGEEVVPAWTWELSWEGEGSDQRYIGQFGITEGGTGCHSPTKFPVASASRYFRTGWLAGCVGVGAYSVASRDALSNRVLEYHATDNPSISNYEPGGKAYEAPSTWSEGIASRIKGHEGDAAARFGEKIASKIAGSGVKNPYATYVEVPNCDGLVYTSCTKLLEERGLKPSRENLTWSEVTTTTPTEVRELDPARSTEVEKGSTVKIITNPDESGMPVVIPAPELHETYEHYAARLNPALSPERQAVSDANEDASAGPDAVLGVTPDVGTKVNPATTTPVRVRTNPSDAPPVGGGGGGSCEATVGAIDWSPLNHGVGSKFPFGVFAFFVTWIGEWEAGEGRAPEWTVTILPAGVFGSGGLSLPINLEFMAPVVGIVRVLFLFASFVGLLWFLGTAAAKIQGDDS